MNNYQDIFIKNLPIIDLHGLDREIAIIMVDDFIKENQKLDNDKLVIVHGIGEGILKGAIHSFLKTNRSVTEYKTDNFNSGITIVNVVIDKR